MSEKKKTVKHKIVLTINSETYEALDRLIQKTGGELVDVVRKGVGLLDQVSDIQAEGGRVLLLHSYAPHEFLGTTLSKEFVDKIQQGDDE